MKILAVADIHGDLKKLYTLIENLDEKPDAIIVAGDLTPFGPSDFVIKIKSALDKVSPYVFMIPGNEDPKDVRKEMKKLNLDMHNKSKKIKDTTLIGFEGARWLESDNQLFIKYAPVHEILKRTKGKTILVSHVPPFDTKADILWTGSHVGSPFLRSLVEDYQPDMVICGHIHESRCVDFVGKTKIVNTGAIVDGYAAWIDTKNFEVSFFKINKNKIEKIPEEKLILQTLKKE